eukprot:GHUV01025838.1.p1 GENE.GHUV01025838.1~~GHUV01025838.1.p1  ORF type:complete len:104 (+),score=7.25 GHUV01025838.1:1233-1544(+)
MTLDSHVCLVRHHVCISHDQPVPDHEASASALTLGMVLPGQEVVWPAGTALRAWAHENHTVGLPAAGLWCPLAALIQVQPNKPLVVHWPGLRGMVSSNTSNVQ